MLYQSLNRTFTAALTTLAVAAAIAPAADVMAEIFNIADGDVDGLIAAIDEANGNADVDNVINLAENGTYILTEAYQEPGDPLPLNGLPVITSDKGKLTINGNGATILRADGAPSFRIFEINGGILSLNDLSISGGNVGPEGGGGIFLWGLGVVTLTNCNVDGNVASERGGGIYNQGGTVNATHCTFNNNTVTIQEPGNGGGAIRNDDGGTVHLTDCTLSGNSGRDGGAISHTGTGLLELHGCTLTQNSGYFGGSIYQVAATALFIRCIISDSLITATNGGAIYLLVAIATVIESTFSGNSAIDGGAIRNASGSTLNLDGCTFTDNSALRGGCGRSASNSTVNAVNCTFSGNSANTGGAWWIDGGSPAFTNCTVVNNTATSSAGGFRSFTGNLEVSQSIVGQNWQGDIFGPWTDKGHNIIEDGVGITHRYTVSGFPLLGPLADNGGPTWTHALLVDDSPLGGAAVAIDAGNCADGTVTEDQRGVPRPQGKACDIGAFELESNDCALTDLNCDGTVDGLDLLILLSNWGECASPNDCPADINDDGVVDGLDLLILLSNWG